MEDEIQTIAEELRRHLLWYEETQAPLPAAGSPPAAASVAAPVRAPAAAPPRAPVAAAPHQKGLFEAPAAPRKSLEQVREELGECTRCKLHTGRKTIVFGVGNPRAELVFVGEGPGADEDEQGIPFVGKAGQLLTKMIEAMGFKREEVYIANCVKCLRYNALVQLENGGWERIGRLVKQRYGGRVMSVLDDGRISPRRVIGWHATPLGDRRVLKLSYASSRVQAGNRATTWLTHDHPVLTRRGYVEAGQLLPEDEIAIGQGLSRVAREVLFGTMLGDGTFANQAAHLSMSHSRDQDEWVRVKARAFAEFSPIVYQGASTNRTGRSHLTTVMRTRAKRALRVFKRDFYQERRKRVPPYLRLTERVLAVWFLDDGHTKINSDETALAEIAAHGFAATDRAFLVERLKTDLGLVAYEREARAGRILFGSEATLALSKTIAPYCPPSMRYKLHRKAAGIPYNPSLYDAGEPETLYDRVVIEPVDFNGTDRTFYCIDVEETHNFVTSGGVVHNCRPPGNRDPEPDEVAACEPFLQAQLRSIQPRVIVALGKWAAQTLLRDKTPITRLRGQWREYQGIKLMPTFHPAYLLRSPNEKGKAWEDLKLVMREFGKTPAGGVRE